MNIYDNYEESQGWTDKAFGTCSDGDQRYFRKEMANLLAAARGRDDFRVLDVGFGNGAFMGWCRANNILCDGLEVNATQIAKARSEGYVAHESFDHILKANLRPVYDAVVGLDILEHIESKDLIKFLADVKQLCRPGALMVFRFPNGDNPFSLWMQNGDLTHRTFIGSGMISQAAIQAGLSIKKIGAPATSYESLSIQRRLAVFTGHMLRSAIGAFLTKLFMAGQKNIVFSPNLIVELGNG